MKIILIIIPLLMLLAGGTCVRAGDTDLEKMPGYVDLEKIQIPSDAEEVSDIDLGPEILKMALGVSDEENPEISELREKIENTKAICNVRRDIARVKTIIRERELKDQ